MDTKHQRTSKPKRNRRERRRKKSLTRCLNDIFAHIPDWVDEIKACADSQKVTRVLKVKRPKKIVITIEWP